MTNGFITSILSENLKKIDYVNNQFIRQANSSALLENNIIKQINVNQNRKIPTLQTTHFFNSINSDFSEPTHLRTIPHILNIRGHLLRTLPSIIPNELRLHGAKIRNSKPTSHNQEQPEHPQQRKFDNGDQTFVCRPLQRRTEVFRISTSSFRRLSTDDYVRLCIAKMFYMLCRFFRIVENEIMRSSCESEVANGRCSESFRCGNF